MSQREEIDSERSEFDLLLRTFQVSRMLRLVADLGIADRVSLDESLRHNANCVRRTRNRWLAAHGVRDLAGSPRFCSNRVKTPRCHRPRMP
jgi:hypothetical protein